MAVSLEVLRSYPVDTPPTQRPNLRFVDQSPMPDYGAMGDLAERDPEARRAIIDAAVAIYTQSVATHEQAHGMPPQHVADHADLLHGRNEAFREYVADPANFEPGVEERIRERYQRADALTQGKPALDIIAARLATVPAINDLPAVTVCSDADGTFTENPSAYLELIPGGKTAEPIINEQGHHRLLDVFSRTRAPFVEQAPSAYRDAGKIAEVTIRPGVDEFLAGEHGLDADIAVVSASMLPFVEGVLERIPSAKDIEIWGVTPNDGRATDKSTVVTFKAKSEPNRAVLYIGDSTSDLKVLDAYDRIAGIFALRNGSFAKALDEKGIPYIAYDDFTDITNACQQLATLTQQYRVASI